ncbi:unnamed protein product [Urochloa humidicola]
MASPAPPIADPQALAWLPTLIDEVLEDIFLRLPTPADVARTSAACPSFRRIITGRSFLRRFRAIHPPPLLGFVAYEGFHPAQLPHPSAPLARAFADAADISYSFVPAGRWLTPWHPRDVRQGRVLLECTPECDPAFEYYDIVLLRDLDLAVCDPLSRRYSLLPRIPKELRGQHKHLIDVGLFLAPTGEDEDETSFRVGRFYWMVPWRNKLLVLDVFSMEVSIVNSNLANYHARDSGKPLIVLGRDRTPEVFFLADPFGDGPTDIIRLTKQNGSGSSDGWQFENMISLPNKYNYFTLGAAEGFVFLRGILQDEDYSSEDSSENSVHLSAESPDVEYLSLDVKTSERKKICVMKRYFHTVYSYFGYPPPLAKPTL